jgi:hypothetical protein
MRNEILKKILFILIVLSIIGASVVSAFNTTPSKITNRVITTKFPGSCVPFQEREDLWYELKKIFSSDGSSGDEFGYSVCLDGDTVLIGADGDAVSTGSAYVFIRNGTTSWMQQTKLVANDSATGDNFGTSVSLDDDFALIGAYGNDGIGSAYIFFREQNLWTQQQKLFASDTNQGAYFGHSVSLDGNTALIGAEYNDDDGTAYVFTKNGTIWEQQAKLVPSESLPYNYFGYSVSLDGDTALIGAHDDDDSGMVYVFIRSGNNWTQQAKLVASDGHQNDLFGYSVSLYGDTALIGAEGKYSYKGAAYVFIRTGNTWTQQAKLTATDGAISDCFGHSVSLFEDTALIGAIYDDDNGGDSGSAYIFTNSDNVWTQQQKLLASDGLAEDRFGRQVTLDGNNSFIGSFGDDNYLGSAYFFSNGNQPPMNDSPNPGNNSLNNSISFKWSIQINDPDGDLFSWTIQCSNGQTNSGTESTNGTKTLSLSNLAYVTTYKVWVNATDPGGSGQYTRRWYTFTTKISLPPTFGSPIPANGTINQPLNFTWSIPITDPEGDLLSWTIQCNGQTSSGTEEINGTKTLSLFNLALLTTYTVWVNATDPTGSGQYIRRWYIFTTINLPPNIPTIDGPTSGKPGISYDYNIFTSDPGGEEVYYWIEWGDGSPDLEWIGLYPSGQLVTISHTFSKKGTYTIRCQAKDINDALSEWGQLSVTMPYSFKLPFIQFWMKLFERFPNAFPLLRHMMGY